VEFHSENKGSGKTFERILQCVYISWIGVLILNPPFLLFIFYSSWGLSELPYVVLTFIFGCYTRFFGVPFVLFLSLFCIESGIWGVFTFLLNFIYMAGMSKWMQWIAADPTADEDDDARRRKRQLLYRSAQILHNLTQEVLGLWFTMTYYAGLSIVVIFSFCILKYIRGMQPLVVAFMLAMVSNLVVSTIIFFESLIKIQKRSEFYAKRLLAGRVNLSAIDVLFLKSAVPLKWKVASMFTISDSNFSLKIYGEVIIHSIMSLLLTCRD